MINAMEEESESNTSISVESSLNNLSSNKRAKQSIREQLVGSPIQIAKVTENRRFHLDLDALSAILLKDSMRDKPVVVVSIAGDVRKGKSFLLNFFLRYLRSGCGRSGDWVGDSDSPLTGFSWRGGSKRETTGILIWSEPFLTTLANDKEVAIILMDTQGVFDSEHTIKDSATVFALSIMIASMQIFNLMHNLQEDNLQILQIFTEYGRLALEESGTKPFQTLMFLIRDWPYPYEYPYGLKGGNDLLINYLAVSPSQPPQLQRVRRHLRSCFNSIKCFLMPHPGKHVATNPLFDGKISDIDREFIEQLKIFVPLMLDPKNIVVKEIGGQQLTGRQLMEYFKAYANAFAGETMPEPKTMLEATAEANNLSALATAKVYYSSAMEAICGGDKPYVNLNILKLFDDRLRQEAIDHFDSTPKMGGEEFSAPHRSQLIKELSLRYKQFEAQNKSKNFFRHLKTPMILFIASIVLLIVFKTSQTIGFGHIAHLSFIGGTVVIGLLITHVYCLLKGLTFNKFGFILVIVLLTTIAALFRYRNQLIEILCYFFQK